MRSEILCSHQPDFVALKALKLIETLRAFLLNIIEEKDRLKRLYAAQ